MQIDSSPPHPKHPPIPPSPPTPYTGLLASCIILALAARFLLRLRLLELLGWAGAATLQLYPYLAPVSGLVGAGLGLHGWGGAAGAAGAGGGAVGGAGAAGGLGLAEGGEGGAGTGGALLGAFGAAGSGTGERLGSSSGGYREGGGMYETRWWYMAAQVWEVGVFILFGVPGVWGVCLGLGFVACGWRVLRRRRRRTGGGAGPGGGTNGLGGFWASSHHHAAGQHSHGGPSHSHGGKDSGGSSPSSSNGGSGGGALPVVAAGVGARRNKGPGPGLRGSGHHTAGSAVTRDMLV